MKTIINKILYIIFLINLVSCKTQQPAATKIYPFDKAEFISPSAVVYALPKTTLFFTITLSKNTFLKGPYCDYAYKYLGVDNVNKYDKTYWTIDSIGLNECVDVDYSKLYIIENQNHLSKNFFKLTKNGLICGLTDQSAENCELEYSSYDTLFSVPALTDVTLSRFEHMVYDTIYRNVFRDSIFAKIPVVKNVKTVKTLEEKAQDAANSIVKIRKRKFKLVSGQYETYPDGEALITAISELNSLEENYLSLFIGRWNKQQLSFTFEYEPAEKIDSDTKLLFRFSENQGIIVNNENSGVPVLLSIKNLNTTEKLKELTDHQKISPVETNKSEEEEKKDLLYYRIPDKAEIIISDGKNLYLKKKVNIYQFGEIITFPVNLLID